MAKLIKYLCFFVVYFSQIFTVMDFHTLKLGNLSISEPMCKQALKQIFLWTGMYSFSGLLYNGVSTETIQHWMVGWIMNLKGYEGRSLCLFRVIYWPLFGRLRKIENVTITSVLKTQSKTFSKTELCKLQNYIRCNKIQLHWNTLNVRISVNKINK